ncbi:GMC oxidoreductase [Microbacterium sp. NPDC086615]|jgi:choline dehydrogenase-like flavoprotein|uniref:GMC family oxidoreductase n=1 Tax=Microbacterium sp. NPDC086615 TaxID=3154865 RepID=UPI003442A052|nr:choline oxidase [Microbacterium sp.]
MDDVYDYVVVGGGTAGCILAARLSEDLSVSVCLIEAGPSDEHEPRAGAIRRWAEMLEGEYDRDYRSVPQERGNSAIRQARLRILGGCSTGNTMITWRPLRGDVEEWAAMGVEGWDYDTLSSAYDRIVGPITPVAAADRNADVADAVEAAASALGLTRRETWNDSEFTEGAGFFEIGYDPETNLRSSTSRSYLHGVERPNLTLMLNGAADRVLFDGGRAVGVVVGVRRIGARRDIILSCGAIDTPALLMRSGIGPAAVLEEAGIAVRVDLPGVGENLQDHAEGLIVWETKRPRSGVCATGWDAGYVCRVDADSTVPDISTHIPVESWTVHAEDHGAVIPPNNVSFAPNVAKPRSRGRVWITSPDPEAAPMIDYRAFTDAEGRDERMLIEGVRRARAVAQQEPFASHVLREVFPGPQVTSEDDLGAILRATHQTVYHVSCTCRMGARDDPFAVVDSQLRVRGVDGLRVVDASVLPTVTALNPVGTVMAIAEHAVDVLRATSRDDRF